jgi:hypothetical protein
MKMSDNKPIEHLEHWRWEQREEERDRAEAKAEYDREKRREEQEECPHDDHEHGVCIECGKDIMDDLIGRAEMMRDE